MPACFATWLVTPGQRLPVEAQIGHQDTCGWWRLLENVAPAPIDGRSESGRPGREVARNHPASGKPALDFLRQATVTRAKFANHCGCRIGKRFQGAQYPALVAHEAIDAPEVPAQAPRGGIIVAQVVEKLGFDDAEFHG